MADVGGGTKLEETPEERLARLRMQRQDNMPDTPDTSQGGGGFQTSLATQGRSTPQPGQGGEFVGPSLPAAGTVTGSGSTPNKPINYDQFQALSAPPATSPTPPAPGSPASILAGAVAGGPPPNFTGTFGGKQYVNGQPVSSGGLTGPASTTGPGPAGIAGPTPPSGGGISTGTPPGIGTPPTTPTPPITTNELGRSDIEKMATAEAPTTGTPTTNTAPGSGGAPSAAGGGNLGGGSLGDITTSITNQLNDMANSLQGGNQPADVMVLFNQQLQGLLQSISQEEARLRADAEKSGTSLDPATEFTLTKMREELDRQLKGNAMALNARGLYDSGILQNAELELRKGNMSEQAGLLSTRLSKINDDLMNSLRSLSSRRLDAVEGYGKAGLSAQLDENARAKTSQATAQQNLLSARLNVRGQLSDEANAQASRSQQLQMNAGDHQFQADQAQLQREFEAKNNASKTQQEYEANAREYQQKVALLNQEYDLRLRNDNATGGGSSAANISRPTGSTTLGSNVMNTLADKVDSGQITTREQAVMEINRIAAGAGGRGLTQADINIMMEAAQQLPSGTGPRPEIYEASRGTAGDQLKAMRLG